MIAPALDANAPVFGLLGSPNAGKTTLFNALTGLRARVGNYPGVTVERREARLDLGGRGATLIDLPVAFSHPGSTIADLLQQDPADLPVYLLRQHHLHGVNACTCLHYYR